MPIKIKNLIFDFGQVIAQLDMKQMTDHFDRIGANNAADKFKQPDVLALWKSYDNNLDTATFRREMKRLLEIPEATSDELFDAAWNSMIGKVPEDRFPALKAYRAQGLKVYLNSNTNDIHYAHILKLYGAEFAECFDGLYFSNVSKKAKPDPENFRQILSERNLDPAETAFFDDRKDNVDGAIAVDIHARVFVITDPMTNVTKTIEHIEQGVYLEHGKQEIYKCCVHINPRPYKLTPDMDYYDPFKLHLIIPYKEDYFKNVSDGVTALLNTAVANYVIRGYKVIDYDVLLEIVAERKQNCRRYTIQEQMEAETFEFSRDAFVPYTIYLAEEYTERNANDVVALCKAILLHLGKYTAPAFHPKTFLYESECPLGSFITFRASNTEANMAANKTVYINGLNEVEAAALKQTGLNSQYYQHLQKALTIKEEKEEKITLSQHVALGRSPISSPLNPLILPCDLDTGLIKSYHSG